MTNGEKIKTTFPHYDIEIDEHKGYVRVFYEDFYTTYPLRWWNAEYEEPIKALEQEPILDKIRAEIDKEYEELDGYDPHSLRTFACRIDDILDKYKTESEE